MRLTLRFNSICVCVPHMALVLCSSGLLFADDKGTEFDWSLMHAREYVIDRHVLRPDASEVPQDHSLFRDWLFSIDPHASIEQSIDTTKNSMGLLSIRDDERDVVVPLVGGPAWSGGMRSAVRLLDKQALEQNTVIGERLDEGTYIEQHIVPEPVRFGQVNSVYLGEFPTIRITGFIEGITLRSARSQLKQYSTVMQSVEHHIDNVIVLDLRYCSGGDIYEATDFGGLWIQDRVQWVSIVNASQPVLKLEAGGRSNTVSPPWAVLVSNYTASACEQLVMGLKAYSSVLVLGERTAGKCSVQTTMPLRGGYFLRISTGRWSGPNSTPCDESGLQPDQSFTGNIHNDRELEQWVLSKFQEHNFSVD